MGHTVVITRSKLYPEVALPGPAWRWTYSYAVDGGPAIGYGTGLASLRDRLRVKFGRDVQITQAWQPTARRAKLTHSKAKRALTALTAVHECGDLTEEERAAVEAACNTVRALCDRIPDDS
jgi:hypothetical protein